MFRAATGAGVNFKIRNDNFGGIGGGTGDSTTAGVNAVYHGTCAGQTQCGYFDFFPTTNVNPPTSFTFSPTGGNIFPSAPATITQNSGLGLVQLVSTNGEEDAFNGILGQQGLIKDLKLPYLGLQNNFNPNFDLDIKGLLDFGRNAVNDPGTANTFDAKKLTNITFRQSGDGASTEAAFQFEGVWNVLQNGAIVQAGGIVVLSQAISAPINTVISQAQSPNGFRTGYSGTTLLTSIPEPNALVGLAVFAGAGTLLNRKRKSK
ncbi:hypothetical protein [Aphanothece sacrum]|uniref:hypothetical protein n=1 Tax=Aphanothece sacrum TaxID=1122 RepID=UPI000F611E4D|nr:hypothetical protein [Aphanothece sacrum]GBF85017.1 hypothetical protein AsFPU3_2072 [Aphanothece sacrum FPU3]